MDKSDCFRAISDPARRAILDLLAERDQSVAELGSHFTFSQPALSQHLKVLRDAGLVEQRRAGRNRIYRLEPKPLRTVFEWVAHYEGFWDDKFSKLGAFLDREAAAEKEDGPATEPGADTDSSDEATDSNDL